MCRRKDGASPFSRDLQGYVDLRIGLRIDDLDEFTRFGSRASGFESGQWYIIDVLLLIIIFHGGGKNEPALMLHAGGTLTFFCYPVGAGCIEVNDLVIRALHHVVPFRRHKQRVHIRAIDAGPVTALAANGYKGEIVFRFPEPFVGRKQTENVEEDRRRCLYADQPGSSLAICITHPNCHHVFWCYADGPSVAEAETGARFPGDLLRRGELLPQAFFARPHHFLHGLEGEPDRGGI